MPRTSHGMSILLHCPSTLLLAVDQTTVTYSSCQPEKLPLAAHCYHNTFLGASAHSGICYHPWVHVGGVPLETANIPAATYTAFCICLSLFCVYALSHLFPSLSRAFFHLQLSCYKPRRTLFLLLKSDWSA